MSPEKIMNVLLNDEDRTFVAFDLVAAFDSGFPIENLGKLLSSNCERAIGTGAYIANELGRIATPCLPELTALLTHDYAQVRSDAIHALRECVTYKDVETISRVLLLLDDPDTFVHRAVMFFILMDAGRGRLRNSVKRASEFAPGIGFEDIAQLLPQRSRIEGEDLQQLIDDEKPIVRRFAVGLACTARLIVDVELLDMAQHCRDDEGVEMVDYIRANPMPVGSALAQYAVRPEGRSYGRWR